MAFKRKRVMAPRANGFKKRKTTRRSRFRKKKFTDFTSLNTKGSSLGYTGRKTSRRTYQKHLWDSTLFKQHWRSLNTTSATFTTPATNTTGTLVGSNMIKNSGTAFWTAAGGAIIADVGGSIPVFQGDLIIRGGKSELTFYNTSITGGDIRVKLFVLRTVTDPNFAFEPIGPPFNWDPSVSPDFNQQIGKSYMQREVLLESGNSYTFAMKIKLQKIDQVTHLVEGSSPLVYAMLSNVGHAVPTNVVITKAWSLSFVGDAQ